MAEDNPVNQLLATRLLQKLGHTVVTASNGREAVAAARELTPDVILMDVQMPEMDGFEATAAIRAREARDRAAARRSSRSPRTRSRATARSASRPAWTSTCTKPIKIDDLARMRARVGAAPCAADAA